MGKLQRLHFVDKNLKLQLDRLRVCKTERTRIVSGGRVGIDKLLVSLNYKRMLSSGPKWIVTSSVRWYPGYFGLGMKSAALNSAPFITFRPV